MRQMLRELAISFGIVAICLVIHCAGLILLFEWLLSLRPRIEEKYRIQHHSLLLILTFTVMIFLHVLEATIWAGFYYWRGLFEDFETSLYFSLGSYTTIGYGDVVLPRTWRLLGAIEGISGVLLCGLSAAFVFAIVNALFRIRIERQQLRKQGIAESASVTR
jgi:Ion channel